MPLKGYSGFDAGQCLKMELAFTVMIAIAVISGSVKAGPK
jgi:hypothetical protein